MLLLKILIWIYVIICIASIIITCFKIDASIEDTKTGEKYYSGTKEYNIKMLEIILRWPYLSIIAIIKKLKGEI